MKVDLRGYCDFNSALQYRLDSESALVLVPAMSTGASRPVLTVEHMQKFTSEEKDALIKSLEVEWTTVLNKGSENNSAHQASPAEIKYWDEPQRKMRRITSEARPP